MARIGTLAINVVANTSRFGTGLRTASREVMGFTGVVNKSMRVLSPFSSLFGAGLVFGGTAAFVRAGKSANDFAGEMNRSLAIMQDVGPKMRAEMERTAHSVAASTQFTAKETARAFFFLASAGMDAQASMAALNQVALFGQAGNFDLATATDLATDAQSAMGLKSKDAATNLANLTHVTDVLTRANTLGNASIQQFSESLTNKAGAAAKTYGISLEQILGLSIAFADQGVKGAESGTRMSIVLRDLTTKSITHAKAFKEAGIEVWRYGEMLPPAEIFQSIEKAMAGMNGEARKTLLMVLGFSDKSIAATQAVLGYGKAMEEATQGLIDLGMTSRSVAESSLTNFDKAWNKIAASMSKASTEAFTPILEQMAKMANVADPAVVAVEDLANASGKVETAWTKIGEGVATVLQDFKDLLALAMVPGDVLKIAFELADDPAFVSGRANVDPLLSAEVWGKELAIVRDRILGTPDLVGGISREQQLKQFRRRQLFNIERMQLPDPFTTQEKVAQSNAKEASEAAAKLVLENAKALSEASDELGKAMRHTRFERGEALKLAGERLTVQMRTPLEAFENKLIELRRIQKTVGSGIDTTVMRAAAEAQKDFLAETKRPEARRFTPGLTPALEAGSVAAAEAIARSMQTSFPVRAAEATAANTGKTAQLTPTIIRLLEKLNKKAGQPGTVETTTP